MVTPVAATSWGPGTLPKVPAPPRPGTAPVTETPSNTPDPVATTPEAKVATPAPAAAKAKPPAPEDKPFEVFVPELLLPALIKEIEADLKQVLARHHVPLVEVMEVGVRSSTSPRFMPVIPRSAPACGAKLCMVRDAGAQVS